jgi:rod shape-determining protein MreC
MDRYVPFGLFGGQASGVILLGFSLLLMLIYGFRPGLFVGPKEIAREALAPSLAQFSRPFLALSGGLDYLFSLTRLTSEVDELRVENKRLEEWYNTAQLLEAENHSLRELLKVKLQPGLSFMTTRVIGDLGGPYAQMILIHGGANDGLSKGDAVMAGEGLIGRVVAVAPETASVLLITDLSSRVPVRVDGSNVQAILTGTGGQELWLNRIQEGSSVRDHQRVYTSGVGGIFQPDLPVGTVLTGADGRVALRPLADFGRLLFVRVVKVPKAPPAPVTTARKDKKNDRDE